MYPAAFEYVAVHSYEEASQHLVRAGGEAKLLAGGCSLIPLMKLRLAEPRLLVDLNRIPDAAYVRASCCRRVWWLGGTLRIVVR